jgi:hypothetical protein
MLNKENAKFVHCIHEHKKEIISNFLKTNNGKKLSKCLKELFNKLPKRAYDIDNLENFMDEISKNEGVLITFRNVNKSFLDNVEKYNIDFKLNKYTIKGESAYNIIIEIPEECYEEYLYDKEGNNFSDFSELINRLNNFSSKSELTTFPTSALERTKRNNVLTLLKSMFDDVNKGKEEYLTKDELTDLIGSFRFALGIFERVLGRK